MGAAPAPRRSKGTTIPVIREAEPKCEEFEKKLRARIARRAHQIYEENGREHGRDLAHWLQGEAELLSPVREVRESGSWLTVNAPLANVAPEAITILVRSDRAIVCVEAWEITDDLPDSDSRHRVVYLAVKWPSEVDSSTCSAYLKDGVVTLSAKYSSPGA